MSKHLAYAPPRIGWHLLGERLRSDIVQYHQEFPGRDAVSSDTLDGDHNNYLLSQHEPWLPKAGGLEERARDLIGDSTEFIFEQSGNKGQQVEFLTSRGAARHIVTMPSKGEVVHTMNLSVNFGDRVFRKQLIVRNPVRTGPDATAVSVLDLVGRELTWRILSPEGELISFGMRFSYDYGFGQRYWELPPGRKMTLRGRSSATVTRANVGLDAAGQK